MSHPIRVLLVGAVSLAAGLLIAFGISLVEIATDVSLYGFSAAVVIPVGAIGCGLVAAVGFGAASRLFHLRPGGPALAIPFVTAIEAFVASHWFTYSRYPLPTGSTPAEALALDGLGFVDFLRLSATESASMLGSSSDPATISRLGSWGYGVVALEILGFAIGGWFVVAMLGRQPWCEQSDRFMTSKGQTVTWFDDVHAFESTANSLVDVLERGGPVAAFQYASAGKAKQKHKRRGRFRVDTAIFECTACGLRHTVISTQHRVDNSWARLSQTPLHPEPFGVDEPVTSLVAGR